MSFHSWKVLVVFPTFVSEKVAFSTHEEKVVVLYPMVQFFSVELGFFLVETLVVWERNRSSCILVICNDSLQKDLPINS